MPEKASRFLFVMLFGLLSLPSLACIFLFIAFVAIGSPFHLVQAIQALGDENLLLWSNIKTSAMMAITAMFGSVTMFHFVRLAGVFSLRGRKGLEAVPKMRWSALISVAAPVLLLVPYLGDIFPADFLRSDVPSFYLSGLALLPSVVHLGIEVMRAERQPVLAD